MPLTNAERKKRYIEKLKATGSYDDFKIKRAAEEKAKRNRIKNGLANLPKATRQKTLRLNRVYNRKKVQEFRQRKKQKENVVSATQVSSDLSTEVSTEPYNTTSALTKAVAKVKRALPSTSTKTKQVMAKLLHSFDEQDVEDIVTNKPVGTTTIIQAKSTRAVKQADIDLVVSFYERDDVSRVSANMRDCRKFFDRITGCKELKQIRYLMYRLTDVYFLFGKYIKNGDESINAPVKFSKFCSLRPKHVKLVSSTPLDTCFCLHHSNFILCCKAMNKNLQLFPSYGPELERLLVCKEPKKECWWRQCAKCGSDNVANLLKKIVECSNEKHPVTWFQWIKSKDTNRFEKTSVNGTINDLKSYFLQIHSDFLKHSYVKRCQAERFERDCDEIKKGNGETALLQIDFPETFKCEGQDEIAAAHWNQANVGLFSSCLKYSKEIHPQIISSDDTAHTKNKIACYIDEILSKLPSSVKTLIIWSDGPNNQFKNKFMAVLLIFFEQLYKIKIIWNFFAAGHGKGCVDGIGAVAKNKVKRMIKSRQAIVHSSRDFVDAFNTEKSLIKVIDMPKNEAEKIRFKLKLNELFNNVPNVKGIFGFHQMQAVNGKIVGFDISQEGYDKLKC